MGQSVIIVLVAMPLTVRWIFRNPAPPLELDWFGVAVLDPGKGRTFPELHSFSVDDLLTRLSVPFDIKLNVSIRFPWLWGMQYLITDRLIV